MINADVRVASFPNGIDFVEAKLTKEILQPVYDEVAKIQNDFSSATKANNKLAGLLKQEYELVETRDYMEEALMPLCRFYNAHSSIVSDKMNDLVVDHNIDLSLDSYWVNFQKKYEYNPFHNHTGVISFVIWLNIPYNIEDEQKQFPDMPSEKATAGQFGFVYSSTTGSPKMFYVPADKTYEMRMLMFPASMLHCVAPFYTSDDYRISVAGNFKMKLK